MALGAIVVASVSESLVGTAALIAIGVLLPATLAGVLGHVLRGAAVLALPLAVSVLLVNALLYPAGGDVVAEVGPLTIVREGLILGAQVGLRVFAIAASLVLFTRTTRPSELVASLERRGVPARATFVVHQALVLLPRTLDRAATVTSAQRARGLDTESSLLRRGRGLVAVAAPTILGAIDDAEARALTLEARGFSRPGPRTLLWEPRDSAAQRAARWLLGALVTLVLVARIVGA